MNFLLVLFVVFNAAMAALNGSNGKFFLMSLNIFAALCCAASLFYCLWKSR